MKMVFISVGIGLLYLINTGYSQYQISIEGNKFFPQSILKHEILFLTFSTAKQKDIEKAQQLLQAFYENHGFLLAEVSIRTKSDEMGIQKVYFLINEGERFYFGNVKVKGLTYNKTDFVQNFLRYQPGQPLSRKTILKYQDQLNNTALFDSVRFSVASYDWEINRVNLALNLKERKPVYVGSGVGVDSEDGLKFITEFGKRHLRGAGETFRFEGFISYYYTDTFFLKHYQIQGHYIDPWFHWRFIQWDGKLRFETDHPTFVAFDFSKLSFENRFRFILHKNISATIGLVMDRVWLYKEFDPEDLQGRVRDRIDQNRQLQLRLTYNNAYPSINPMRGIQSEILYQYNGGILGGSNNFNRVTTGLTGYIPLSVKQTIALHLRGGWMERFGEVGDIPEYLRFFLGGSRNIRGYRSNKLGPKDALGNALGGLVLLYGSLELRQWLSSNWQLVWFLDSGELKWRLAEVTTQDLVFTAGPGIRYNWRGSLFSLDIGIKLNKFQWENPGWFHIGYGQHF